MLSSSFILLFSRSEHIKLARLQVRGFFLSILRQLHAIKVSLLKGNNV